MLTQNQAINCLEKYAASLIALAVGVFLYFPVFAFGESIPPPCPFGGLETEFTCSTDTTVNLTIDFNAPSSLEGDNTFIVEFNGETIGSYNYYTDVPLELFDLPIEQGNGLETITFLELIVADDFACNVGVGIPGSELNCQCDISNIDAEILFCETEETAVYRINSFDFFDVANSGFTIEINEQTYPSYNYNDLPLEISGPLSDGENEVIIKDIGTDECSGSVNLESFACAFCSISNLEVEADDCSEGQFSLTLDFDFENISQDGFFVSVNGVESGPFEYTLPFTFGSFTGGELNVKVFDELNVECQDTLSLEVEPCATCEISDIAVEQMNCDEGAYELTVDFENENIGSQGFEIFVNGIQQGEFAYEDLPVTFGAFSSVGENIVEIIDIEEEGCSETLDFLTVACLEPQAVCTIHSIAVLGQECVTEDGTQPYREYELDLDYNDAVSDSFDVYVQGSSLAFGRYAYTQLPIVVNDAGFVILPGEEVEVDVIDFVEAACASNFVVADPIDCLPSCVIGNIAITSSEECLEDGTFEILLSSDFVFDDSESFYVTVNGGESMIYNYGQLPIVITDNLGDGETSWFVELLQVNDNTCNNSIVFNPVLCPAFECSFESLTLTAGECQPDGSHTLWVDAINNNPGDSGFNLVLNGGVVGTMVDYADLPLNLGMFIGNGETNYVVEISDDQNSDACATTTSIEPVICEGAFCNIENLSAVPLDGCEDGSVQIQVNFSHTGVSSEFRLTVNAVFIGQFPYSALPLTLPQAFLADGEISYEIEVVDSEDAGCLEIKEITPEACMAPQCELSNLDVQIGGCDAFGFYEVTINFDHLNGSAAGFKVLLNNTPYASFTYDEIGEDGVVVNVDGNPGIAYGLSIADTDNGPACSINWPTLIDQDCGESCFLPNEIPIIPGQCDDANQITLVLALPDDVVPPATADSFTLVVNAINIDNYHYNQLPIPIGPYDGDGSQYLIELVDLSSDNCTTTAFNNVLECAEPECSFVDATILSTNCNKETGEFTVDISVDIVNPGENGLEVVVNDTLDQGTFMGSTFQIGPLPGDGVTDYEILIFDVDFADCSNSDNILVLEAIDCIEAVCDITAEVSGENCIDNIYDAVFEVNPQNQASDSFVVVPTNAAFDIPYYFAYDDPPFVIENLPWNGDPWEFDISDIADVDDCSTSVLLSETDCLSSCLISGLTASSDCDDDGNLSVVLEFDYANVGSQGFIISYGDQEFMNPQTSEAIWQYEDDLLIEITGLDGTGGTSYTFTVTDVEFQLECQESIDLIKNDPCEIVLDACVIDIISTTEGECIDGLASVIIEYEYQNVVSDSFLVEINDITYGPFLYSDAPFVTVPLLGDNSEYTVTFIDPGDSNCDESETYVVTCQGGIKDQFTVGDPYPVPTLDEFVFSDVGVPEDGELTIEVFNTQGQLMGKSTTPIARGNHEISIDLDGYIAGMYYVRSSLSGSDFVFVGKILKANSVP